MDAPPRLAAVPHRRYHRIETHRRFLAVAPPADACLTVSVEEYARHLGVSKNVVYEAIRIGQVPAVRLGGRKYAQLRIPAQAIFDLLEAAMAAVGTGDEPCQSHRSQNGAKTEPSSAT